ncbi:MAG: chalcone isomerase family protein [Ghiorsea sp.]|nr:chalcone isomerase family protein [Ghiorsea sp.]
MDVKVLWLVGLVLGLGTHAYAVEIEGVQIADSVKVGGQTLILNGAGIRSKFFFDIYIGALYLANETQSAETVINSKTNKRVWMYFLYDEVSKGKLTYGWTKGFERNSKTNFKQLETRLNQFNNLFHDMKKSDAVAYDFNTDGTTTVIINGKPVGSIAGQDFQQALLSVWLGKKPADSDLKEAMLGND